MASPKILHADVPTAVSHALHSKTPAFFLACFVLFFLLALYAHNSGARIAINVVRAPVFSSCIPSDNGASLAASPSKNVSPPNTHARAETEKRFTPPPPPPPPKNDRRAGGSPKKRASEASSSGDRGVAKNGIERCDLFDGRWVEDDSGPNYAPGVCPFVDESFNCYKNGRQDLNYTRLRWQPSRCNIPRLEGKRMLEMLRGKRLAFVGDSLNRNMWVSLVCTLRQTLRRKDRVSELSGRQEFKTQGFYSFRFIDYNCTIDFFRTPFLVQEWEKLDSEGKRKETLRLDLIDPSSMKYRDADVIVFNTGHWWTHPRTSQGKEYYQEGDHLYTVLGAEDAYRKALSTWARWVDDNINSNRTRVFFRGYSSSHFNGGQWNTGGSCDGETLPIENDKYLARYPKMMIIAESVLREMRTPVVYLNVTRMTDYRKDGHPSVYSLPASKRMPGAFQDCSHWCLPGVPDAWNEILYAILLRDFTDSTSTSTSQATLR